MRLLLLVPALAAGLVAAQNIPPCVLQCSGPAATAAGCSNSCVPNTASWPLFSYPTHCSLGTLITRLDITCVCNNLTTFTSSITPCILSTCSPNDQAAALGLQKSLCADSGVGSPSASSSTPVTGGNFPTVTPPVGTVSVQPASTASASTSPNGAIGGVRVWTSGGFVALGASVMLLAL
ncbi:hypothetical protein FRC12_003569 [Ceratobasidium sp. 428]|nr:hypothetical protein FRC12_003569 [Ceratobasidium sp. 428]